MHQLGTSELSWTLASTRLFPAANTAGIVFKEKNMSNKCERKTANYITQSVKWKKRKMQVGEKKTSQS